MNYSPFRWVILAAFMLITMTVEIQWLTHASVARPAELFYKGQFNPESFFNIDFLAASYMILFLVVSFPASYIIDTFGIRAALRIGAALAGLSAMAKALFAGSFVGVAVGQAGLAIAQPFILNAVTAVSVRWFPLNERALAAGMSALAQYIGILAAMLVTPHLVGSDPALPGYGTGFEKMLLIYGIMTLVSALVVFIAVKEHPEGYIPTDEDKRDAFGKGMLHIFRTRDMQITIVLFLIGLGIFNAISSMTDRISEYAGVKDSDGLIGGVMLIGGIIGAIILPALSDRFMKRKLFLVICIGGMVPAIAGMAFAGKLGMDEAATYNLLLVFSFLSGFCIMSAGPIGFQYAAEVSRPAPESASQGILLWTGQLSGIVFVALMSMKNNRYLGLFLIVFTALSVIALAGVLLLRESSIVRNDSE